MGVLLETFLCGVCVSVRARAYTQRKMYISRSLHQESFNWSSHCGLTQPWDSRLIFRGVLDWLPISDKFRNSKRSRGRVLGGEQEFQRAWSPG